MSSGLKVLETVQVGKEVTAGTLVAATRRLIVDGRFRRQQDQFEFTEQNSGVFARVPRGPVPTRFGSEIELRCPLDFEQILLPLQSGMKGAVTPTGGGADKTWTFLPSTSTPPALEFYTVEYTERSPDDDAEMEFGYGFTTEMEITATSDGLAELRWTMMGRATQDSTLTGALTVPTLNYAANLRWAAYIDTSWAGLGGTQIAAQVYGFRWVYRNNVHPGYFLDNRSGLDFTQPEYGRPECEIEMDVVHDPDSASFVQAQEAIKVAGTQRFIQFKLTGASLGGSNYSIILNAAAYHAADSMEERGNDRDGNLATRAHFLSAYDATSSNHVGVTVVNALTAFPS